jgi:hypothetical protein
MLHGSRVTIYIFYICLHIYLSLSLSYSQLPGGIYMRLTSSFGLLSVAEIAGEYFSILEIESQE